ncbi:MAG TPA: heavy metal translocating P-type ATPase [Deltaproteobacteria bacterium]|nr:heavy metal translocating P-type ATPase [Deltaproteobacteria bacterium]
MNAGVNPDKTDSDDQVAYKRVRVYPGRIRLDIEEIFHSRNEKVRNFLGKLAHTPGVTQVKFSAVTKTAIIHYTPDTLKPQEIFSRVRNGHPTREMDEAAEQELDIIINYTMSKKGGDLELLKINRYGDRLTTWKIKRDVPGRIRLRNPFLLQNRFLAKRLDFELAKTTEITKYNVSYISGGVLIVYNEKVLNKNRLICQLDQILFTFMQEAEDPVQKSNKLALSSASMVFAVVAGNFAPWLIPFSVMLILYTAKPIFQRAIKAAFEERKIKVDLLDALVTILGLVFGQFGSAAFMVWILDMADKLMEKTTEQSKIYLDQIFGKQVRFAYLLKDGQEIQVPIETLKQNDIISVNTGDQIPVDGIVVDGEAMIDQHNITGESAPVERSEGEEVFASTLLVAGKALIKALKTGENTYASQIIHIINAATVHKVKVQSIGERLADRMVVPTLGMGALGLLAAGPNALLAIINSDYGTGIRVAAPVAMLSHLAIAAKQGVLIKEAHVLESLKDTDVVLFDKTGTLTKEVPEVSRIIPADGSFEETQILLYAAAAEQRFSHPISRALLTKSEQLALKLPPRNDAEYQVGFGINVRIYDDLVKVGSSRYFAREKIHIPESIQKELGNTRAQGKSAIFVAVNEKLAGMIEFQSSSRPEAGLVIDKLRRRGIREIVLISGDHEAPTKYLADQLCVDRYYSGILPHEKAEHVRLLQQEGKKVIMVGDGVNDSVALSCADIGISISGASTIAMDVSDVVFMDGDLNKFDYLFDISEAFNRNVRRSFLMILIPNTLCIALAFFRLAGLPVSMVLNNGFNFLATINGMLPYFDRKNSKKP